MLRNIYVVTITFEAHATTEDNEVKLASGWYDTPLSPLGQEQARQLGDRYAGVPFDAIFCSDLQRSFKTAELAFGDKYPIIKDARLRECDYGDMTRAPKPKVEQYKATAVTTPFPNGESYRDTSKRIKELLSDLLANYNGKHVMIIGHRATQYGLEEWIKTIPLKQAVLAPWQWQPGWEYRLIEIRP